MRAWNLLLVGYVVCSASALPCRAQSVDPAQSQAHTDDAAHDEHDLHHPTETPIAQGYVGDAWADEDTPLTLGVFWFRMLLQTRYEHTYATSSNSEPTFALREDVSRTMATA